MEVRPATEVDMRDVNDIYNHYVRSTPASFDLDESSLDARLRWFETYDGARYRIVVATDGGEVIGYACSRPFNERRAYETSVATAIYVGPGRVGRGVGRALYGALFDAISGEDLHRAYAGITMPNDASVALHRSFGFEQTGYYSEQGRKFGRYWDVAWFEKAL